MTLASASASVLSTPDDRRSATPRNQLAAHAAMHRRRGAARTARRPALDARFRRSSDGIVASYIRELALAGDTPHPDPRRT